MSAQQTLLEALSQGAFEKILDALKTIFETAGDKSHGQEVLLITSRYNQIKADENRGVISSEEARREKNRITMALSGLIAEVPDTAILPSDFTKTNKTDSFTLNHSTDAPNNHALGSNTSNSKIPLFIGIGAILVAIALIVKSPCPSGMEFFVIRILMALGVGALAYYLTGSLQIKLTEGVKAGGALAVLAMIYLLNPAGGLAGKDCITEVPVTVFVHGDGGQQDIVLRQQGHILMDYRGERKRQAISENGEAYFNNLKVGEKIHLNVDFSEPYKATNPDSTYIIDESGKIYLKIALQNLDKVFGKVIYKNNPLPGVTVSIGSSLRDTTDDLGNYVLNIPKAQWKKEQEVSFFKPGFRMLTKTAFPQTNEPLNLLMIK